MKMSILSAGLFCVFSQAIADEIPAKGIVAEFLQATFDTQVLEAFTGLGLIEQKQEFFNDAGEIISHRLNIVDPARKLVMISLTSKSDKVDGKDNLDEFCVMDNIWGVKRPQFDAWLIIKQSPFRSMLVIDAIKNLSLVQYVQSKAKTLESKLSGDLSKIDPQMHAQLLEARRQLDIKEELENGHFDIDMGGLRIIGDVEKNGFIKEMRVIRADKVLSRVTNSITEQAYVMPILAAQPFLEEHSVPAKDIFNDKLFKTFVVDPKKVTFTQPTYGLLLNRFKKGVHVCGVLKGSPAEKAALKLGDQIIKINSASVIDKSLEDILEVINSLDRGTFELLDLDGNVRDISLTKSNL